MIELITNFVNGLTWAFIMPGIGLGLLCIFISSLIPSIPFVTQYKLPLQVAGVVLILFFTYQSGRKDMNQVLVEKNVEQEVVLQSYRENASQITAKADTQFITQTKYIDKIKEVPVIQYVTPQANQTCVIAPVDADSIRLYLNTTAKGIVPSTTSDSNAVTTTVK